MAYNQIIYCSDNIPDSLQVNSLQQKLGGVVRHYRDFINLDYFDNNIIISDGLESCTKYFRDIISLNSQKVSIIPVKDADDYFVYNLIENTKYKSILGAASFNGTQNLEVVQSESFSFNFCYNKKTLEKIYIQLQCSDRKHSIFQVSVFDGNSTKCLFNKDLRYMEAHLIKPNEHTDPEYFLEVELDNPQFDAGGKKYSVTVKYLTALEGEKSFIFWKNDYSPHKFLYRNTELFGCTNFFAY